MFTKGEFERLLDIHDEGIWKRIVEFGIECKSKSLRRTKKSEGAR